MVTKVYKIENKITKLLSLLKEHTLYKIEISWNKDNPLHTKFLFNGFASGGYTYIPTSEGTYSYEYIIKNAYSIIIVQELCSTRD